MNCRVADAKVAAVERPGRGIRTWKGCVARWRIGRRTLAPVLGKEWPQLRPVWPTCARLATAWRVGQGCRDRAGQARNRGQKQKGPPSAVPGGPGRREAAECY